MLHRVHKNLLSESFKGNCVFACYSGTTEHFIRGLEMCINTAQVIDSSISVSTLGLYWHL